MHLHSYLFYLQGITGPVGCLTGPSTVWAGHSLKGGTASSGHPVDGSAQGGRRRRWPVQFRFVHGVRRTSVRGWEKTKAFVKDIITCEMSHL